MTPNESHEIVRKGEKKEKKVRKYGFFLNGRFVVRTWGLLKSIVLYSINASCERCDINWILNKRENLKRQEIKSTSRKETTVRSVWYLVYARGLGRLFR